MSDCCVMRNEQFFSTMFLAETVRDTENLSTHYLKLSTHSKKKTHTNGMKIKIQYTFQICKI